MFTIFLVELIREGFLLINKNVHSDFKLQNVQHRLVLKLP